MTNKKKQLSDTHSVWDEKIEIGRNRFHGKGSVKALLITGAVVTVGAGAFCLFMGLLENKKNDNKTQNDILKNHEKSKDKISETQAKCECDIQIETAKSSLRINERKAMMELRAAVQTNPIPSSFGGSRKFRTQKEWIDAFRKNHAFPDFSSFLILRDILKGTPEGHKDAMLFHLLSMFGGLCFSRVRAKFLDGRNKAPNVQAIIVGESGSGKSNFKHVYDELFSRIIESDRRKMASDSKCIIQTVGLQVSNAKFYDILANNRGVHMYAMEEELAEVNNLFGKKGKLDYNILRKAFDNGTIFKDNMSKWDVKGSFEVFYNYTFTGTPGAMEDFFPEKQREGGTARRHIIAPIPELDINTATLRLPKGERLENIRNQIDEWRDKFCYTTQGYDEEVPCTEYPIDLSYVCDSLEEWSIGQYKKSARGGAPERNSMRNSMSAIAFNCAIVLHMLAGEPGPKERSKRKAIKEAVVYIADYCMERYIYLFGKSEECKLPTKSEQFCHPILNS